jgi:hypothetical protein
MTKESKDQQETWVETQRAVFAPYDWMARAKSKAVITKEVIEIPISNAIDFGDLPSYPRLEEIKEAARKLLREDQINDANLDPQDPQFQSRMEALEEILSPLQGASSHVETCEIAEHPSYTENKMENLKLTVDAAIEYRDRLTDMEDKLVPIDGRSSL